MSFTTEFDCFRAFPFCEYVWFWNAPFTINVYIFQIFYITDKMLSSAFLDYLCTAKCKQLYINSHYQEQARSRAAFEARVCSDVGPWHLDHVTTFMTLRRRPIVIKAAIFNMIQEREWNSASSAVYFSSQERKKEKMKTNKGDMGFNPNKRTKQERIILCFLSPFCSYSVQVSTRQLNKYHDCCIVVRAVIWSNLKADLV